MAGTKQGRFFKRRDAESAEETRRERIELNLECGETWQEKKPWNPLGCKCFLLDRGERGEGGDRGARK
jgi:hypothetical protein